MTPRLSALSRLFHAYAQHPLLLSAAILAALLPSIFILRRMGFSGWWALIAPISPLNILGLWVLAFKTWPMERRQS